MLKRGFDLVVSVVALSVLWPFMLIIGLAIRLDSRGPALFRQERVGRDGTAFRILKFRSMRVHHDGVPLTAAGDPRITRVGLWLRTTKLDELPQLLNVLVGQMSLVGPRPEVAEYVALWPEPLRPVILSVRPGITDPATVLLRHEAHELAAADDPDRHYRESLLPRKAAAYAHYVQTRTFTGDLLVLLRTMAAVFTRSGRG